MYLALIRIMLSGRCAHISARPVAYQVEFVGVAASYYRAGRPRFPGCVIRPLVPTTKTAHGCHRGYEPDNGPGGMKRSLSRSDHGHAHAAAAATAHTLCAAPPCGRFGRWPRHARARLKASVKSSSPRRTRRACTAPRPTRPLPRSVAFAAASARMRSSIGHLRLSQVRRRHVQDLVDDLIASGLAGSTVKNACDPLRKARSTVLRSG